MDHQPHDHDGGLAVDLPLLLPRRHALKVLAGAGLVTLVGCGSSSNNSSTTTAGAAAASSTTAAGTASSSTTGDATADCDTIPEETAGPFPGDGSNGPNVLTQSGIVRGDIRSSFGSASGVADGVPLTITLTVSDGSSCKALANAAVYVWQCDRQGRYSLYSRGATGANYLRGVQETDTNGRVTFTSIFPAAYPGRWPHIHFEVYPSLDAATRAGKTIATSQMALPADACSLVYATSDYSPSIRSFAEMSLKTDNVFRDGVSQQLGAVTGSVDAGFTATLAVPV